MPRSLRSGSSRRRSQTKRPLELPSRRQLSRPEWLKSNEETASRGGFRLLPCSAGRSPRESTQNGTTTAVSGTVCPTTTQVNVGNGRPQIETQNGATCVQTVGGTGASPYSETYLGNQTALTLVASTALTPTATATIVGIRGRAGTLSLGGAAPVPC